MKVLVVAPQPFFAPRGTPMSVYYRTATMAELGATIDLLTYGLGEDIDLPGVRHIRIPRLPFVRSIPVGPSIKKLVHDLLMILWTVRLCRLNNYQAVHAHEEAIFWCAFIKRWFGFKLIYDMHSSLPQQLDNFGQRRFSWLKPVFTWLESKSISSADLLVTICPELDRHVAGYLGCAGRHILIENSIFDPVRLKHAAGNGGLESNRSVFEGNKRWIYYGGTFEPYQGIELLVDAMPRVLPEHPDAMLLLAGGTPSQVQAIASRVKQLGVSHAVSLVGSVPMAYAKAFLSLCAVVVSPRIRGSNTPMKIYEHLASGKPLVSTRIWSHTQILTDEICFLVEPNAESIAQGLITALADTGLAAAKASAARAFYQTNYSKSVYTDKVRQVIARVS